MKKKVLLKCLLWSLDGNLGCLKCLGWCLVEKVQVDRPSVVIPCPWNIIF